MKNTFAELLAAVLGTGIALWPRVVPATEIAPPTNGATYVIEVEGPIEKGLLYVIRRGIGQAEREKAGVIVLVMNTPGGQLDSAKAIVNLLRNVDIPTYSFVRDEAISAGAIISLATDEIYMAPGSSIGDAMPIAISMFGGIESLPEEVKEKMISYVSAWVRSVAQDKGHDARLAECMVRPAPEEYRIGDDVICRQGQLLTLTNEEAERMVGEGEARRRLLSSGTAADLDEFLAKIGRLSAEKVFLRVTWSERVARWIESLRVLFLIAGFIGLYVEFKTPGFGVPGIAGIACLVLFFWGHHVAGLAAASDLMIFAIGLALLIVELLFIPGFGVAGVSGILLMLAAVLMAMVQHYPGGPMFDLDASDWQGALMSLSTALVASGVLAFLLAKYLPGLPAFRRVVLTANTGSQVGYTAGTDTHDLVGRRGIAATQLHPAGTGEFGDLRLPVMTRGDFFDQGAAIVIVEVSGNRIVVDRV